MKEKKKFINADGFSNATGDAQVSTGDDNTVSIDAIYHEAMPADKTANQQYKDYVKATTASGGAPSQFKDWLTNAQKSGQLKNAEDTIVTIGGDLINLIKEKKAGKTGSSASNDDILSKLDKSNLSADKKPDKGSAAFLGVPMPVWYITGVVIVIGVGYALVKGKSGDGNGSQNTAITQ